MEDFIHVLKIRLILKYVSFIRTPTDILHNLHAFFMQANVGRYTSFKRNLNLCKRHKISTIDCFIYEACFRLISLKWISLFNCKWLSAFSTSCSHPLIFNCEYNELTHAHWSLLLKSYPFVWNAWTIESEIESGWEARLLEYVQATHFMYIFVLCMCVRMYIFE